MQCPVDHYPPMSVRPLLQLVALLVLAVTAARASVTTDFLHCIERGDCGLDSVCSFVLPADPQRCVPGACVDLTGQIMRVRNGLDHGLTLTWDAPGSATTDANGTTHVPGGTLQLEPAGGRYFDTGLTGSHTVRLRDGAETLDTTVADWRTECTPNDACHYLLRACFDHSSPRCTAYARHCGGFAESPEEAARRQRCIPNCFTTFYLEDFAPLGPDFDAYAAMDYDAVTQGVAWLLGNGTNVTAYILAGSVEAAAQHRGLGGGAIVAILLAVLALVGGAVYLLYVFLQRRIQGYDTFATAMEDMSM